MTTRKQAIQHAIEAMDVQALDAMQVRGDWAMDGKYTGYDYREQRWVTHQVDVNEAVREFAKGMIEFEM